MTFHDRFIHLRCEAGATTVRGSAQFFRGHRIARGRGEPEDGVFAGWTWDATRLEVRTDRYGAAPLFYWSDGTDFCVSPSLLAVLQCGAPAAFDLDALAAFLRLGYFLGDDTPFAAIRTVPPGAVMTWQRGQLACRSGRPVVRPLSMTRDQAIDGFVALCRQSIRRRLPAGDGVVMPLSSGRDSRHILYELHAAGVRPSCVTIPRFAPRPGEDQRIAPLVAAAVGLPHVLLRQNSSRCDAEVRKNWITHLCADEHAWYVEIAAQLGQTARTMYDGLGGALSVPNRYHSFEALDLIARGDTRSLADRLLTDYGVQTETFLSRLLRRQAYAELSRERAVARLARELDTHGAAADPIKSFNFWNRIRRELALWPYAVLRDVPHVYAPYLDHDLFDLLMGLAPTVMSPTLKDGKTFHTDAINRAFPQFAGVPFENKKAPGIDARAHNARLAREAGAYILRHARWSMRLLDPGPAALRAACGAVRPAFGERRPWFSLVALYLTQLEMAAAGRAPAAHAAAAEPLARAA
jgi:hypothetical protein